MIEDGVSEEMIARLLSKPCSVCIVGASENAARPVFGVMEFLIGRGYDVCGVNPALSGRTLLGRPVFASVAEVPAPVDIVDIFRNSAAAGVVVDEAIAERRRLGLKAVWMQLGVINEPAAARARDAGLIAVMDRCPKIEIARLRIA